MFIGNAIVSNPNTTFNPIIVDSTTIPTTSASGRLKIFTVFHVPKYLKDNNEIYQFLNLFSFVLQVPMRHVMTTGSLKDAKERNRKENVERRRLLKIAKRRVIFAQVKNE